MQNINDNVNIYGTIQGGSGLVQNKTSAYSLASTDNGTVIVLNAATDQAITVPAGLPIGFNCILVQLGVGSAVPTASSTTIHPPGAFTKTGGQYATASLLSIAQDVYILSGNLQ